MERIMTIAWPEGHKLQKKGSPVASVETRAPTKRRSIPNRSKGDAISAARHGESFKFTDLYELSPVEQIDLIRTGVPPDALKVMIQEMDLSQEKVLGYLALPMATINRKIKRKELLSPSDSARVLGLASLIGQVQTMVERSGNPEGFDAAKWLAEWMERPLPALGGTKPAEYLDTIAGQQLVGDLLAMMESGAYA
jgi:putative toxin-antitoxin system antitoxin component (TIGR02293 family)